MKRIIGLTLILSLILCLPGCAKQRDSGAADGIYTLKWQEQRDNSYLLTLQSDLPEGYEWSVSGGGIVAMEGPVTDKKGNLTYKVREQEIGTQTVMFSVSAKDGSGFSIYSYSLEFSVDRMRELSLVSCTGKSVTSETVIGEGEHTIICRTVPGQLQLILDENVWHYSHENSDFLIAAASLDGKPVIIVHREDTSTVISSTARMGDEPVDEDAPAAGEILAAFYAEKDDVLTVECYEADTTYRLNLHMDNGGNVTVTDWTQETYTGSNVNDGLLIYYDEVTGLSYVTEPDGYVRGTEDKVQSVAERMAALHAENYLVAADLYQLTPEDVQELGREGLLPDYIVEWAGGDWAEAEAIYAAMLEMNEYELEDFRIYLAQLEEDGPREVGPSYSELEEEN